MVGVGAEVSDTVDAAEETVVAVGLVIAVSESAVNDGVVNATVVVGGVPDTSVVSATVGNAVVVYVLDPIMVVDRDVLDPIMVVDSDVLDPIMVVDSNVLDPIMVVDSNVLDPLSLIHI